MSGTVTGLDLDRLEELAGKATPGPWRSYPMDDVAGCSVYDSQWLLATVAWYDHNRPLGNRSDATGPGYIDSDANAEFIAEFRNAVPSLLAAARAVRAVRELHQPEKRWHDGSSEWSCDTAEEAAEHGGCEPGAVMFFEVCSHCGEIEARQAEDDWDYLGALALAVPDRGCFGYRTGRTRRMSEAAQYDHGSLDALDHPHRERAAEIVHYAREVIAKLEYYGPGMVPHLLDTDDNDGQRLREALDGFREWRPERLR